MSESARQEGWREFIQPRQVTDTGLGVGYGWFCTDPDSDNPILWTAGTGEFDHNAIIAIHPAAILVVTSNRFDGDVPWSQRAAGELEPILLELR